MPADSNATYIPTMNEFCAHWEQVDIALTPDLSVMGEDGVSVALDQFEILRDDLQELMNLVIARLNDQEIARGDLKLLKRLALDQLNAFLAQLDAFYAGTAIANARPNVPSITEGQDGFMRPLVDMLTLWETINTRPAPAGVVLPLVLTGGLTQAQFAGTVANLTQLYVAERRAAKRVDLARAERDVMKLRVRAVMKGYRLMVLARCAAFPALVETIPDLTAKPGHTPKAVAASAVFVAPNQAKVVYEASEEEDLARYELRGHPGEEYDEEDAVVIETNDPQDVREFLTNFGLTQPGASVALKVFVRLGTGNEAGSAAMVVTRPET